MFGYLSRIRSIIAFRGGWLCFSSHIAWTNSPSKLLNIRVHFSFLRGFINGRKMPLRAIGWTRAKKHVTWRWTAKSCKHTTAGRDESWWCGLNVSGNECCYFCRKDLKIKCVFTHSTKMQNETTCKSNNIHKLKDQPGSHSKFSQTPKKQTSDSRWPQRSPASDPGWS